MQTDDFLHLVESRALGEIPMVCSIGVFDGVHRGHQEIITTCVRYARRNGWKSMVVTFNRNPKVPAGVKAPLLMSQAQKRQFLAELGVDYLVVIDFSPDFSKLTGVEFLNLLGTLCTVKGIVVGVDFRCGTPASCAGPEQLQEYLDRRGPGNKLLIPPYVRLDSGERVSSSLVRKTLKTGDLPLVEKMLGRYYSLDLRGSASGYRDGSLWYPLEKLEQLLPPCGTYVAQALTVDGTRIPVVARLTTKDLILKADRVDVFPEGIEQLYVIQRYGT